MRILIVVRGFPPGDTGGTEVYASYAAWTSALYKDVWRDRHGRPAPAPAPEA
jgi:hypothetical protein